MTFQLPLAFIEALMLVSVRMTAFLVVAPPFSHRAIPARIKAMLGLGLALLIAPRMTDVPSSSSGVYIGALVTEVLIGAALGFLVFLAFSTITAAGSMIDLFGGFQMAQAFDPMSMINGAQFTKLFQMTALVLLFATGSYQVVLLGLARTFEALPVGAILNFGALGETVTAGMTGLFLGALQIAGPLMIVLFLADVGLGLVTRVAPALNAFALGFPLKILLALTFGTFVFLAMPRLVETVTGTAVTNIFDVVGLG